MPLCTFSKNTVLMDITPVENLYICEYMLKAPGDYVKVYIYGLMQCHYPSAADNSLKAFSSALGMEENAILDAFKYWQRRGLLKKACDDPLQVEYFSVKGRMLSGDMSADAHVYQYAQLNKALQDIFGGRMFSVSDYQKIYDWIEVYGLDEKTVILLVNHCVSQKGKSVRLSYMDKVAMEWADAHVITPEKAEEYIASFEFSTSNANHVLRHIGLKRRPTADELSLYNKWANEWGFSLDCILYSCREMTKIQTPNFAYIDRVLENYRQNGLKNIREIEEYTAGKERSHQAVSRVLYTLGLKGAPNAEQIALYQKWTQDYLFSPEVILLCAKSAAAAQTPSFAEINRILSGLAQKDIKTEAAVSAVLEKQRSVKQKLDTVFERAGIHRQPTSSERAQFEGWLGELKLPLELVLLAAEYSAGTQRPFAFLKKVLENWVQKGIRSVSAARKEHEQQAVKPKATAKGYIERDNSDEEWLKLAYNPGSELEE